MAHRRALFAPALFLAPLLVTAPVAAAPLAADSPGPAALTCAPGSVSGAGSTFVAALAEQWINIYEGACPSSTVVYDAVGSGTGTQEFVQGQLDLGASDFVLDPADLQTAVAKGGQVLQVPWAAGGVALEYKIKGVLQLNLSAGDIARIFSGRITRWDDWRLKKDNPGVPLPSEPITVVYRSDGSGTTNVVTSYLTAIAGTTWAYGSGDTWKSPVGLGAKGSDGVTDIVRSTEGAIGYAQLSYAEASNLSVADLKNASGHYVAPGPQSVTAALHAATVHPDGSVTLNFAASSPGAYPLSTTTWAFVFQDQASSQKAALLKSFLTYAVQAGQSWAAELGYAPLTSQLVALDLSEITTIQA